MSAVRNANHYSAHHYFSYMTSITKRGNWAGSYPSANSRSQLFLQNDVEQNKYGAEC